MALSDVIKKIEDSPRSTKVAVLAVGVAIAASAVAVFTVLNQADSGPEPTSVAKAVTADQSPEIQAEPTLAPALQPTPSPVPTSTPEPSPTPETVEEPTPSLPTLTPTPIATPTPDFNGYHVVLHRSKKPNETRGVIVYNIERDGGSIYFNEVDFYLEYLRKEGVITSEQKNAYFNGERIKIPVVPIANATYKLHLNDGDAIRRLGYHLEDLFIYANKSSVDSNGSVSGIESLLAGSDQGYVTISDGKISISAVDDDGNTTTVQVEGVGAKELLDYWLSQSKITVEQKNEYGQTGEIQFSLKDGVDLFDFGSSLDGGGSFGLDKESRDIIVKEILPLFKIGD